MDEGEAIEEESQQECYGEYGITPLCKDCVYAKRCKKFMEAERTLAYRNKGKYTGRGKTTGRDKY